MTSFEPAAGSPASPPALVSPPMWKTPNLVASDALGCPPGWGAGCRGRGVEGRGAPAQQVSRRWWRQQGRRRSVQPEACQRRAQALHRRASAAPPVPLPGGCGSCRLASLAAAVRSRRSALRSRCASVMGFGGGVSGAARVWCDCDSRRARVCLCLC